MEPPESGTSPKVLCPHCGSPLIGPLSGDLHCYYYCEVCREEFDPKDPRIDAY